MNRRCGCAASSAYTSFTGRTRWSSHGDSRPSGAGRSGVWKISSAQIICTQVVPVLDRVLITMSPSRNGKPSQRALSSSGDRYRNGGLATRPSLVFGAAERPERPSRAASRRLVGGAEPGEFGVDGSQHAPHRSHPRAQLVGPQALARVLRQLVNGPDDLGNRPVLARTHARILVGRADRTRRAWLNLPRRWRTAPKRGRRRDRKGCTGTGST